jgi:hypothetical protein
LRRNGPVSEEKTLRIEGPQLTKKNYHYQKEYKRVIWYEIWRGNEGDTPIYISNIHPHGCK